MKAIIETTLPVSAKVVWSQVKLSRTLQYICSGLLRFGEAQQFPKCWEPGQILTTRLYLFEFIPLWKHQLRFCAVDDINLQLVTEEGGGLVKVWNHTIEVQTCNLKDCQIRSEHCHYRDIVEIQAGMLTPLIYGFAHLLYRYRQKRWQNWVKKN
ncbi:hypothetical protein OLMES_2390 [Oleiphilus messinensis]|uniref:Uncharacterized protein n=1 Tax=Oleiphilus messinensis TaxID=141451 RepID=A0A1Y0I7M4_9GAMM|nr:hypothetical protein [Oleiphilus messinensis]ARU56451.1 hypothetical protein OLMES_2390 [Oleiphilus messinensis]